MSKSKGNVISALDLLKATSQNAVRFFFLKEGPYERDETFDKRHMVDAYNSHLVNELANSLYRITNPKFAKPHYVLQATPGQGLLFRDLEAFIEKFNGLAKKVYKASGESDVLGALPTRAVLMQIVALITLVNQYINQTEFWKMSDPLRISKTLAVLTEAMKVIGIFIYPVVPEYSERLLALLKVGRGDRKLENCEIRMKEGMQIDVNMELRKEAFLHRLPE